MPAAASSLRQPVAIPAGESCVLCGCRLETEFNVQRGLCGSCAERPEASRVVKDPLTGRPTVKRAPPTATAMAPVVATRPPAEPRAFTAADKALIRKLHAHLPATQILQLLNDRLHADLGAVPSYTLEQLQAETATLVEPADASAEWSALRRVLAAARTSGVLQAITPTTIDDFVVVFQLTSAQKMHLLDVIQHAKEGQ